MVNKETLIIALKLFLITALTALLLAVVNKVTAPVIASNNEALAIESQKEVLPEADDFISGEAPTIEAKGVTIDKVNVGVKKADGSVVGYVVTATSSEGYGGALKVMVGINKDLKVNRVKIMESAETAGLGANASKPKFIDQFIGKESQLKVVKGEAKDDEISAIASATITSKAVTSCVNAAITVAKEKHESNELLKTAEKLEEIKRETEKQISVDEGGDAL